VKQEESAADLRLVGVVKFYKNESGYGFIVPDDGGSDLFFHCTEIEPIGVLDRGHRVRFEIEEAADGRLRAIRVRRLD
jgi:CspA family cold shock protein